MGLCEADWVELVGGDVVLEVVEHDPSPVVALGQGPVGQPGEQPPGVLGTVARRYPQGAHCGGRDAAAAGEHGEFPITVLIGGGKLVNADSDRGQDTGVLVAVRPVRVGDRIDVRRFEQPHHLLPGAWLAAAAFHHPPDQRHAQGEVPDAQA